MKISIVTRATLRQLALRFGAVVIIAALLATTLPSPARAFSGSGSGTDGDPYQITTCTQLQSIQDELDASYLLMQNIDCSDVDFAPIGSAFTGNLDGQNHIISGLSIEDNSGFTGMFRRLSSDALVQNFQLMAQVSSESSHVGILAGATFGTARISHVMTTGEVTCTGASTMNCGGVVGFLTAESQLQQAASTAMVTNQGYNGGHHTGGLAGGVDGDGPSNRATINDSYFAGSVETTHDYAGGVVGYAMHLTLTKSYAIGSVSGQNQVGGLAGNFSGYMADVFAANSITGTGEAVGPITGHFGTGSVGNRYFDQAITGFSSSPDGSTPIDDENYFLGNSTNSPFDLWDFLEVWVVNYNGYPSLAPFEEPVILCEEPQVTTTTFTGHCTIRPLGWGTPTWQARWRKVGDSTWQTITLPDEHLAQATLTGLSPGTDYQLSFRFTNNWGTSPWGTLEGRTLGDAATTDEEETTDAAPTTVTTVSTTRATTPRTGRVIASTDAATISTEVLTSPTSEEPQDTEPTSTTDTTPAPTPTEQPDNSFPLLPVGVGLMGIAALLYWLLFKRRS